ncbi:rod shape-determining protein [Natronomonas sp. F2-12]|jgi:actin-like ATPase involved in cell morphogenesis|uniref:Rod shape-determining protein n=1 Tax=Natronomonas aquatica TaxID=2841590 RepID=A0A9R1D5U4_9EURY|nr:rod shape-determining protein [Natronomonas aquatica]MCQ4332698.1 rod shape-determining protein [Natronomonas aquatica]
MTETEPEPDESADAEKPTEADEPAETTATDGSPEGSDDDGVVPVGVKLGSTRTVVIYPSTEGDGVETIRTLTCLATYEDVLSGQERVLYGEEAASEYPDRVEFMLRSGLPEDDESVESASRFFTELIESNDVPENSAVVYAIPTIDNDAGLENLEAVIEGSRIGGELVRSYPESLCGALPAFEDGLDAIDDIFVTVNMGSTNLEVCAYRRGEQLTPLSTGSITGNEVDRRIANYVEEETQGRVNIDLTTAREYKEEHADFESFEPFTDVIQQPGGGSHEFTIEDSVMDACNEYVDETVDEIANGFLPELANNYMKVYQLALGKPIVLTGGMACLPGIVEEVEERLSAELQRDIEVVRADRPDLAAAEGAHVIADHLAGSL